MASKKDIIKLILGALFVVSYQIIIAPRISLLGAQSDMALILTVWMALTYGSNAGIYFGLTAGVLTGLLTPMELGWAGLLLSFIGYFTGNLKTKFVMEPIFSRILVLLTAALVYNFLYIFFTRFELLILNFSNVLLVTFKSTLNCTLVGIIVFIVIRYRFILRKLI